jgi:hypothetical protein
MRWFFGIVIVSAIFATCVHAIAAVALAVGITDYSGDGIAIGFGWNQPTTQKASEAALSKCQGSNISPKAAKLCRLIGSIDQGCTSAAFDPDSKSPGMGWAVAKTRDDAKNQAMTNCQDAAPPSRKDKCETNFVHCDGDPP